MDKTLNDAIDIVIPWVDGNDIKLKEKKNKYLKECSNIEGNNAARYRDWGTLKYVLRSVEKNIPWFNKIYLITDGQKPCWLKENSKIEIVDHKDFIPDKYLPTFNSHVIELNLFRIKGLSEKFIYFNDDTVVSNKLKKSYFFKQGLPCDSAILNAHCPWKSRIIYNIALNDVAIINEHFNIKNVIKSNIVNWFNPKYGLKNNIQNLVLYSCPRFPGFKQDHMPTPMLKSSIEEIWKLEPETLDSTSLCRFRTKDDVNQWLIKEYQFVTNRFIPSSKCKKGVMIDFEKNAGALGLLKKALFSKKYATICINDGDDIKDIDSIIGEVGELLERKFSQKCSFEV